MKRPNPLPPDQMNAAERRNELCGLLAIGLIRLASAKRPKFPKSLEKVAYTYCPTNAVMQPQPSGETHDEA